MGTFMATSVGVSMPNNLDTIYSNYLVMLIEMVQYLCCVLKPFTNVMKIITREIYHSATPLLP